MALLILVEVAPPIRHDLVSVAFFYRPETVMACCGEQSVHRNHPQLVPPPRPQVNRNDLPLHGRRLPTRVGRNYDTIESATLLVASDTSNCKLSLLE